MSASEGAPGAPLADLQRLCVHTITTKPWSLAEAIENYVEAGVRGVTVWRDALEGRGLNESAKMLADSGLQVVSLCRSGFFPAWSAEDRRKAVDDNLRAIEEAAAIGAPLIVLVCGAVPGMDLSEARRQIADGIAQIAPVAAASGVKLGIEPLHPMYADCRSAVNTLEQANDMIEQLNLANVGAVVDVYHLWWDNNLRREIARCGDKVFAFHVCDWRTPTRDMLLDRGLMGEGCIPLRQIRTWVEETGFHGPIEVEIFSETYWAGDQKRFLKKITEAYLKHC